MLLSRVQLVIAARHRLRSFIAGQHSNVGNSSGGVAISLHFACTMRTVAALSSAVVLIPKMRPCGPRSDNAEFAQRDGQISQPTLQRYPILALVLPVLQLGGDRHVKGLPISFTPFICPRKQIRSGRTQRVIRASEPKRELAAPDHHRQRPRLNRGFMSLAVKFQCHVL